MAGLKAKGHVTINIDKRLPVQGGLGGASTNAVATLLGLERALRKSLPATERLRIAVVDRGPGIPQAELERVFEPFYRLDASRNIDSGGTGLGLSIARNIARWHGGDVTLRNAPDGKGLIAALTLPRNPAAD